MSRVSEITSSVIGDSLSNIKSWGNLFYNAQEHGVLDNGTDVTDKLQTLVNRANSEGRTTIVFPAGDYFVTSITNDENIVYFGDGAKFVGGYSKVINSLSVFISVNEQFKEFAINVKFPPAPLVAAIGDGTANDNGAINAIIELASATNNGVYIPPGTFIVESIQYKSNVAIYGSGIGATILKLKDDAANVSVLNTSVSVENIIIRDLMIDGNRDNQTSYGHGIRSGSGGGIINGLISNVYIKNAGAYGIGLQQGTYKNLRLENIITENTGLDGIDMKNTNNLNDAIIMNNIIVINPGLDTSQTVQAGIDCRGPVLLSNIFVRGLDRDQSGIRFRPSGEATGIGGRKSSITNFSVYGTGAKSGTIGVAVGDPDVRVSNGYIYNSDYGIITESTAQYTQIDNVEIETANINGMQIVSEYTKIRGCVIKNSTTHGIRLGASNVEIKDTTITGSGSQGIRLLNGFTGISITGNDLRGNGTAAIRDDGATYTARNNKGWVTEANVISGDVDCSTTGVKTTTITHGLSVTPALQDILLTTVITSGASYVLDSVGVVSVNGTSITARVNVVTVQASGVCKIAAQVRTKHV